VHGGKYIAYDARVAGGESVDMRGIAFAVHPRVTIARDAGEEKRRKPTGPPQRRCIPGRS